MAKKWTEDERRAGERISDFSGMRIVKPKEKAKKRYEYMEKPAKCPECGYARITNILYGLPIFSEELDAEMKA